MLKTAEIITILQLENLKKNLQIALQVKTIIPSIKSKQHLEDRSQKC